MGAASRAPRRLVDLGTLGGSLSAATDTVRDGEPPPDLFGHAVQAHSADKSWSPRGLVRIAR